MQQFEILAILAVVYFVPSFVAQGRRHASKPAIIALNALLGWTFLGWVAALVWALSSGGQRHDRKRCPACAETVLREAIVCRYCGHEFLDAPVMLTDRVD